MEDPSQRLIADLLDRTAGSLRAVMAYREENYEMLYIPGDVEDQYTEDDFGRIHGGVVLAGPRRCFDSKPFLTRLR